MISQTFDLFDFYSRVRILRNRESRDKNLTVKEIYIIGIIKLLEESSRIEPSKLHTIVPVTSRKETRSILVVNFAIPWLQWICKSSI